MTEQEARAIVLAEAEAVFKKYGEIWSRGEIEAAVLDVMNGGARMTTKTYFRCDGVLVKTYKHPTLERAIQTLHNLQADWARDGLHPLTEAGSFEPNNAHEITREDDLHLTVITTAGKRLTWTVKEGRA